MSKVQLDNIQKFKHPYLLFRIGVEAGFYSEYNNMLLCILWCRQQGIEFILSSKGANFAPKMGWKTYFLPFCKEWNLPYQTMMNLRYHAPEPSKGYRTRLKRACFSVCKRLLRIDNLTYDVFWTMRKQEVTSEMIAQCRDLVKQTYRFNTQTERAVSDCCRDVPLPNRYVAMHIRRGDKTLEAPHTALDKYMKILQTHSDCRDVFVATDDYTVIEQLKEQYCDLHFFTLCSPQHRGYDQRTFDAVGGKEKDREMISLFADVEILSKAECFVGTLSSNIGMFLYLYMPEGRCIGVDYQEWRIW